MVESGEENLPNSMRVVDVINMAVVPTPPTCRFVALSYLWGGVGEEYWTAQANVKQREMKAFDHLHILLWSTSAGTKSRKQSCRRQQIW